VPHADHHTVEEVRQKLCILGSVACRRAEGEIKPCDW